MKIRICYLAIAVSAMFVSASAVNAAPPKKSSAKPKTAAATPQKRKVGRPSNAEVGLVGVKLFDPGARLISLFGSPDDIQAVSIGGATTGAGGGGAGRFGAGPGGPGAGPTSAPASGGGGGSARPADDITSLDSVDMLLFAPPASTPPTAGGGPPTSIGGPSRPAGPAGPAGAPGMAMPGGGGGIQAEAANNRTVFTRWVYKRGGSRYGFIMDKFGRVIEIEAVGLKNPKVRTKKGIGFGATFAAIWRKYGAPDAYEISQSTIVVRYLVRNKVAFRLNRLGVDKPHVVTGVVVAAGKS